MAKTRRRKTIWLRPRLRLNPVNVLIWAAFVAGCVAVVIAFIVLDAPVAPCAAC